MKHNGLYALRCMSVIEDTRLAHRGAPARFWRPVILWAASNYWALGNEKAKERLNPDVLLFGPWSLSAGGRAARGLPDRASVKQQWEVLG